MSLLGLLIAVVSFLTEYRPYSVRTSVAVLVGSVVVAPGLESTGSIIVVHRLSCSTVGRIFPNQGSNMCLSIADRFFITEPPRKHKK